MSIAEFKTLHLLDSHISQVFLYFAKTVLPNNYASLSRFGADATAFFEALLSLGDSENEVIKIRTALDTLRRAPGEPFSGILLKINSLYSALYAMSQPHKSDKEVVDLVLKHKIYLVGAFVNGQALGMLRMYARERASKGRNLTLEEIIQFIKK